MEDDYEFWVISDANTPEMTAKIENNCLDLGIQYAKVPQEIHDRPYLPRGPKDNYNNPNVRHCNSVQWAWDNFFSHHDGPVMVIDSDMFLIRPFSVEKMLENNHFTGVLWGTNDIDTGKPYSYLWLALILFNNALLPERETICFNCGILPNTNAICDRGGWTNLYLTKFKETLKVHNIEYIQGYQFYCPYRYADQSKQNFDQIFEGEKVKNLKARGFTDNEIALVLKKPYTIELLGNNHFLHYRAGTNYEKYTDSFLLEKDKILLEFFETILTNP